MNEAKRKSIKVSFDKIKFSTSQIPNVIINNYPESITLDGIIFKTTGPRFNIVNIKKVLKNGTTKEFKSYYLKNIFYNEIHKPSWKKRKLYVSFIPRKKLRHNHTQASISFIPTIKSNFTYQMILEAIYQLGLDSTKLMPSSIEIAIDFYNYEINQIRNMVWTRAQSIAYCYKGKNEKTITTSNPYEPPSDFTTYWGNSRHYKGVKLYKKTECGETFVRLELTMCRGFLRGKVEGIEDFIDNDFNWIFDKDEIGFYKINYDKLGKKYKTPLKIKNLAKKYALKEVFMILRLKYNNLKNEKREYLEKLVDMEELVKKELAIYLKSFLG